MLQLEKKQDLRPGEGPARPQRASLERERERGRRQGPARGSAWTSSPDFWGEAGSGRSSSSSGDRPWPGGLCHGLSPTSLLTSCHCSCWDVVLYGQGVPPLPLSGT